MGWLQVLLCAIATVLFWVDGSVVLSILAAVAGIGSFWSWGVMHNYATEEAKNRLDYTGGFYDLTRGEINSVPNWITNISMLLGVFSLIAFITSLAFWWF